MTLHIYLDLSKLNLHACSFLEEVKKLNSTVNKIYYHKSILPNNKFESLNSIKVIY